MASPQGKSPAEAYAVRNNIVFQFDTVSDALSAAAKAQHYTKCTAEVTAAETRSTLDYMGGVVSPSIKRGR